MTSLTFPAVQMTFICYFKIYYFQGKHNNTKYLGSSVESSDQFLAGDKISLADLVGLGVAKTWNISTPGVNKWRQRCSKLGYEL